MIAQKENPKRQTTKRPVLRSASFDDYDQIAAVEEANGTPNTPRKQCFTSGQIIPPTACHGPGLLAYAIFERREVKSSLKACRREGIHALGNIGRWLEEQQPLVARAPYRRKLRNWYYLYKATNPQMADALVSPHSWCPTHYDADASV